MRPSRSMRARAASVSPLKRAWVAPARPSATSARSWTTWESISAMSRWKAVRSSSGTHGTIATGSTTPWGRLSGHGRSVHLSSQHEEVTHDHQRHQAAGERGQRAQVVSRPGLVDADRFACVANHSGVGAAAGGRGLEGQGLLEAVVDLTRPALAGSGALLSLVEKGGEVMAVAGPAS